MKISEHFTLEELTVTNSGYVNSPSAKELGCLKDLVNNVLEPLRVLYGKPITVNSGYRSPLVNKKVGGASTSQHVKGQAVDITGGNKAENNLLFSLIRDNFDFDQVIDEQNYTWIHVSYKKEGNRKQVLKMVNGKYTKL